MAAYPITFVSAGTPSASVAQHTIVPGTGRQADDIDWLIVETANEVPTLNVAAGFVLAGATTGQGPSGAANAVRLHLYWRRWNGSDGSPEISVGIDHSLARIVSYRGVRATGNPWGDVLQFGQLTTAGTSGSITGWNPPNVPNQMILAVTAADLPDAISTTEFSSWVNTSLQNITERADNTTSVGSGGAISCTDGELPTYLSLAATTFTSVTSSLKEYIMLALSPTGPVEMAANGAATSSGVATMGRKRGLVGNGTGCVATGVATMVVVLGLVALGAGTSDGVAVMSRLRGMVSAGGGSATGVASMTVPPASDFVAKVRHLRWRRDVFRWHARPSWRPRYILPTATAPTSIIANGVAGSSGVAALGRVRELTAIGGGTSSGVASMGAIVPLTAIGAATSSGEATLGRLRGIVATGGGVASGLATMGRDRGMVSNGAGTAGGVATLTLLTQPVLGFVAKTRHLHWCRDVFRWHARPSTRSRFIPTGTGVVSMASHGAATSAGTAVMGRARGLVSNGTGAGSGVATLQRLRGLVANDGGTSAGVATMGLDVGLVSQGAATSTGLAAMGRLRGLVVAGAATSGGVANLTIQFGPAGVVHIYLKKRKLQYRRDVFRWRARAITRNVVVTEPLIADFIAHGVASSSGVADLAVRSQPILKLRRAARWSRLRPIDHRRYGRIPVHIHYLPGGLAAMTSNGAATSGGTAVLQRVRGLVASGSAAAGGFATMGRLRGMVVNGAASSSGFADLTVTAVGVVSMRANGTATSSGVADMGRLRGMVANGAGTSAGTASMGVDVGMVAIGAGSSSGLATMGLAVGMTAIGGGVATGFADMALAAGVPMTSNGVATSSGVAAMGLQVSMVCHGGGTSSGLADLQGTDIVALVSHGQAYSFGFARMTGVGRPGMAWWAHRKRHGRPLG